MESSARVGRRQGGRAGRSQAWTGRLGRVERRHCGGIDRRRAGGAASRASSGRRVRRRRLHCEEARRRCAARGNGAPSASEQRVVKLGGGMALLKEILAMEEIFMEEACMYCLLFLCL